MAAQGWTASPLPSSEQRFKVIHLTGHRHKPSRNSPIAVPLQMAGLLSALVFLGGFTLEVLVINNLYLSQHILVVALMLTLAVWTIVEVYAIRRGSITVPPDRF